MNLRLCLLLLLAACCPVPLAPSAEQVTAFRAEVAGVSPELSALYVKSAQAAPLTLIVEPGVLRSSTGQNLPLTAFAPGDSVYVQATFAGDDVYATQVRRLE